MHTTVLYHANCPDGFGAALACYQELAEEAEYLPVQYGQPPPAIPEKHHVVIVDFSYDEGTLRQLHVTHKHVIVIDHHKSAQETLMALYDEHIPGLGIVFDLEESGATLAWKWFNPGYGEAQMPHLFHYVRDRDLWQWQLRDSHEISAALWSHPRPSANH